MRSPLSLSLLTLSLAAGPARAQSLAPEVADALVLEPVVSGLEGPVGAEFLPDGRLVVIEQGSGRVLALAPGAARPEVLGTIAVETGGERGLLGLAVDPRFAESRRLYLYYSAGGAQRVAHVALDPATGRLDLSTLTVLLDDLAANRNHNGGGLAFGPDGHLYVGVGDTGCNCGCAPGTNENNLFPTCLTSPNGKLLRIDREGGIPATNPLVGVASVPACGAGTSCRSAGTPLGGEAAPRTELYAWGFRNPWRFGVDPATGHLWVGDVGEVTFEEVTIVSAAGQHHGWPFREGRAGREASVCGDGEPPFAPCVEPAFAYGHDEAPARGMGSVTGGVFSSGCRWPAEWRGLYWFGDYNKNRVWTLTPNAARDGVEGERRVIVTGASGPVHFFAGLDGAIHFVAINDGSIHRIAPRTPADCGSPDAGAPDTGRSDAHLEADGGATPDDAGARGDTGARADTGPAAEPREDEGCGCRGAGPTPASGAWIASALLGLSLARRTKRRGPDRDPTASSTRAHRAR
jgi:MYXO-CTERM domain-containing protein